MGGREGGRKEERKNSSFNNTGQKKHEGIVIHPLNEGILL